MPPVLSLLCQDEASPVTGAPSVLHAATFGTRLRLPGARLLHPSSSSSIEFCGVRSDASRNLKAAALPAITSFTEDSGEGAGKPPEKDDESSTLLKEASDRAYDALKRASRTMADAFQLHNRNVDVRAARDGKAAYLAVQEALESGSKIVRRWETIKRQNSLLGEIHDRMKSGASTQKDMDMLVKNFGQELKRMELMVEDVLAAISKAEREMWKLDDVYGMAGVTPSLEDTLEPPPPIGQPEQKAKVKTAAGCFCDPESTCDEHGRPFTWCIVDATKPCPLREDVSQKDLALADHTVAGAGIPVPIWDYCRPPPPLDPTDMNSAQQDTTIPYAVHRGCRCNYRGDVLQDFTDRDDSFKDENGTLLARKIPHTDKAGIEAIVVHHVRKSKTMDQSAPNQEPDDENNICTRTFTSGQEYVCPASSVAADEGDASAQSDPGWCSTHSWDFCVPPEPDEGVPQQAEAGVPQQAEADGGGGGGGGGGGAGGGGGGGGGGPGAGAGVTQQAMADPLVTISADLLIRAWKSRLAEDLSARAPIRAASGSVTSAQHCARQHVAGLCRKERLRSGLAFL